MRAFLLKRLTDLFAVVVIIVILPYVICKELASALNYIRLEILIEWGGRKKIYTAIDEKFGQKTKHEKQAGD
ncbi:MAG: hypothetical protein ACXWYM_00130 [Candidatus Binatia bacterium]